MPVKTKPVRSFTGTSAARKSATLLRNAIRSDKSSSDILMPYYVAAVCAHMEGELNNCFVEHLHNKLGKCHRRYLRPYLFMKVQDRMELAPLLLSEYRFRLNDKCGFVKSSLKLFNIRNRFLHVKDLWYYAEVEFDDGGDIIGLEYHAKNHPDLYRIEVSESLPATISIDEIEEIQRRFTTRFRTMPNSLNRKNFRPDEWLVRIKKDPNPAAGANDGYRCR